MEKVVIHNPKKLAMYRSTGIDAVLGALLELFASQNVPEYNRIFRDCCNLVLNCWGDVAPSSSNDALSKFTTKLTRQCLVRDRLIRDCNVPLISEADRSVEGSARTDIVS